jgi:hypothetical protein
MNISVKIEMKTDYGITMRGISEVEDWEVDNELEAVMEQVKCALLGLSFNPEVISTFFRGEHDLSRVRTEAGNGAAPSSVQDEALQKGL